MPGGSVVPWLAVAVDVLPDWPDGRPEEHVSAVLEARGIGTRRSADAPRFALYGRVASLKWTYVEGLLQTEARVTWSMTDAQEAGAVVYRAETRGLATRDAERRRDARRAARHGDPLDLPLGEALAWEALSSSVVSLSERETFRSYFDAHWSEARPVRMIDIADRSALGIIPEALAASHRHGARAERGLGTITTLLGIGLVLYSGGRYHMDDHVQPAELTRLRVGEVTGWGLLAAGATVWLHGDQRVRRW